MVIAHSQVEEVFTSFFELHGWEVTSGFSQLVAKKTYETFLNPTQAIVQLEQYCDGTTKNPYFWLNATYLSCVDNPLKNCARGIPQGDSANMVKVMRLFLSNIEQAIDNTPARKWLRNA